MEHEVFVPVPADRLSAVLADPARVARAVPGLQQEAGAEPVAGRLKVRVGNTTITYRGTVRVSAQEDGTYAVEGDATETRGTGSVKLALTLRVRDTDGGSTLTFDGTASADGRVTELSAETVASAVTRLLNRTAERLGTEAQTPEAPAPETAASAPPQEHTSVFDTEVPPPSLAPDADDEPDVADEPDADDTGAEEESDVTRDFEDASEPPAEAAHARRTMIGRSAEEVDHAPPRGRYAPVPAPQTVASNSTLRWAAPAAALALASAIILGRALRRRH
ncbi:SRPBCC family protein [Streptomyces sp. PSKA30]|uniref:SRPBCC family protein n=1 Tax=Streptomyces sp. PSKA30 TaxID=2874597 RepID=UPI001CD04D9B|nr:SRPBCC domain-containing protein [Streptomyces sp. PSKA30]MBZ9640993.1 SRPBCC family protein [Streptomyces sp. PSKA30]